jgi:hypothetical protein
MQPMVRTMSATNFAPPRRPSSAVNIDHQVAVIRLVEAALSVGRIDSKARPNLARRFARTTSICQHIGDSSPTQKRSKRDGDI